MGLEFVLMGDPEHGGGLVTTRVLNKEEGIEMSAFMVAPECINSIVTYIHYSGWFGWLKDAFGYDVTQNEDLERLANALHLLNYTAIVQRYGERRAAKDKADAPAFAFRFVHRDAVAVHKALCCLQYQCSEGDVPELRLFQALDSIMGQIADDIVNALPAYEKAPWGD